MGNNDPLRPVKLITLIVIAALFFLFVASRVIIILTSAPKH